MDAPDARPQADRQMPFDVVGFVFQTIRIRQVLYQFIRAACVCPLVRGHHFVVVLPATPRVGVYTRGTPMYAYVQRENSFNALSRSTPRSSSGVKASKLVRLAMLWMTVGSGAAGQSVPNRM